MLTKSVLLAVGLFSATVTCALASPTYDSLLSSGLTGTTSFQSNSAAIGFKVSSTTDMDELELALERTSTTTDASGSVTVTLYSNNGLSSPNDGPGSILAPVATIADTLLSAGTVSLVDIYGLNVILTAGTTYWIEIQRTGTNKTNLEWATDASAPSAGTTVDDLTAAGTTGVGSATDTSTPPEYALCVSADGSCASTFGAAAYVEAPEPATIAVMGSSLVCLGYLRRRQTRRDSSKSL